MAGTQTVKIAAAVVGVAVIAVAGVLIGTNLAEDDPSTVDAPPTTAEDRSTTTERDTTTSSSANQGTDDPAVLAVWPAAGTSQRFDDPSAAARSFAVELAGFPEDTLIGDFEEGDARSGEVEVRAFERGPVTTVLVRQLGDDESWWVIGAATENIEIDEPTGGSKVSSPLEVRGSGRAFEGTIEVEVRADGQLEPIGGTFVTGGSDQMRPFTGRVEFAHPGVDGGALMLRSRSAEDGSVMEATVVRLLFD